MTIRKMAVECPKLDPSYTVAEQFRGAANIQWVARFCGDYLGARDEYRDAVDLCVIHRAKFLQGLTDHTSIGPMGVPAMPVIVKPGYYVTRDGRKALIQEIRTPDQLGLTTFEDCTAFNCSGSIEKMFRGKPSFRGLDTWHTNGRRLPLKESPGDIVGPYIAAYSFEGRE